VGQIKTQEFYFITTKEIYNSGRDKKSLRELSYHEREIIKAREETFVFVMSSMSIGCHSANRIHQRLNRCVVFCV